MTTSEVRFRARYAETDQMGVVYHAHYLVWMEMGRVELCRQMGVRYRDMEEQDGILMVVAAASSRYLYPARYDDSILVHTWIKRATSRLAEFEYEIQCEDNSRTLMTGATTHVFCDRELRPARLPEKYWHVFGVKKR